MHFLTFCLLLWSLEGSLLDHTKYRWECGVGVSIGIVLIQTAQIGTTEDTWVVMAVLEAINGFISQVSEACRYVLDLHRFHVVDLPRS